MPASLQRVVAAEGLRPRLLLSRTVVDFEERVVSRDRNVRFPYHTELTLTNRDEQKIQWEADTSGMILDQQRPATRDSVSTAMTATTAAVNPIFSVDPSSGELEPGEARTLRVSFQPDFAMEYDTEMPLFLDG